jgi:uncharacterized protein (TIGR02145 family)
MKNRIYYQTTLNIILIIALSLTGCKKKSSDTPAEPAPEVKPVKVIEPVSWNTNVMLLDTASYTFSFADSLQNRIHLASGDYIVTAAGRGCLRKVDSIELSGNQYTVYTSFARLSDVVVNGELNFTMQLSKLKMMKPKYIRPGVTIDTIRTKDGKGTVFSYNFDTDVSNNNLVHLTGQCILDPTIHCSTLWDLTVNHYFHIEYQVHEELDVSASINLLNLQFDGETELMDIPFEPVIVYIGAIPVVLTPEIKLMVGANLNVESSIGTGVNRQYDYTYGITYQDGQWTTTETNNTSTTFTPPTLTASGEARAYVHPEFEILLYDIVGPYLYGEGYLRLEADLMQNPWWSLFAGVEAGFGVHMNTFGLIPDYPPTPFYTNESLLAQASGQAPTITTSDVTSVTQTSAVCGGNVTSQGSSTVTARGVCWSNSPNPTTSGSHTTNGSGTGSFTSSINGLIGNTPYYVRAYAVNSVGTSYGDQKTFTTAASTQTPSVTTNTVNDISQTTATCGGNVTSQGSATVTARGVCWSTSQNPTTASSHTSNGSGTGSFTSSITGLTANTPYYVRAYATNSAGTSYGDQKSFTTTASTQTPTVSTNSVTNITQTTAVCGGNVSSQGSSAVTARGVCWSTNQNPTISSSHTSNGSGTGSFTSNITGLMANTPYYVRAYATNTQGTAYGSNVSFTTQTSAVNLPTVSTTDVTNVTQTGATSGGNVTSDGGGTVTARGVCWTTSCSDPTVSGSHTTNGSGTGSFTSVITGLTTHTQYLLRAYATNSAGTAYGNTLSFTTKSNTSVTDFDGNVYNVVTIGTQTIMAENLKATHYRDGSAVTYVENNTTWHGMTTGAYCWYNNDQYTNKITYGALYNSKAALDTRKLCPAGWHIPSGTEWTTLMNYLGGEPVAGGKLKEACTIHWLTPNQGATNSSGFTGVPGGAREDDGTFGNMFMYGTWWSSDGWPSAYEMMYNNTDFHGFTLFQGTERLGFSVRCIKD